MTILSADTDGDLVRNVLKANASSAAQERGTSVKAEGKTDVWRPMLGFHASVSDPQDVISQVTYTGLTNIFVQPVGKAGAKVSLGTIASPQVTCF